MWYKLYAEGGRGHKGEKVSYVWRDDVLTNEEKEDLWEAFVKNIPWEHIKGNVSVVKTLPEKVRQEKIAIYLEIINNQHEDEHKMLKILGYDKCDILAQRKDLENGANKN